VALVYMPSRRTIRSKKGSKVKTQKHKKGPKAKTQKHKKGPKAKTQRRKKGGFFNFGGPPVEGEASLAPGAEATCNSVEGECAVTSLGYARRQEKEKEDERIAREERIRVKNEEDRRKYQELAARRNAEKEEKERKRRENLDKALACGTPIMKKGVETYPYGDAARYVRKVYKVNKLKPLNTTYRKEMDRINKMCQEGTLPPDYFRPEYDHYVWSIPMKKGSIQEDASSEKRRGIVGKTAKGVYKGVKGVVKLPFKIAAATADTVSKVASIAAQ